MTTCKNCVFEFEEKFCPQCGQKAKTKRITTKTVWEEVRRSMIHYDSGFFFTMLQLLRRPGHAIREYLEGKRTMHFKPVKFMLLIVISVLLALTIALFWSWLKPFFSGVIF